MYVTTVVASTVRVNICFFYTRYPQKYQLAHNVITLRTFLYTVFLYFYEFLSQKLICLLSTKIVIPPIKDMVDHPTRFKYFFWDANEMQDLF